MPRGARSAFIEPAGAMARQLRITGVVQGVGYRQWMCAQADAMGVSGWVRNRRDGSVEAVIDGPPDALEALIERARRGPSAARVESVDVSETQGGGFTGFEWRASG